MSSYFIIHGLLHLGIEQINSVALDVVVTGGASQIGGVESATGFVESQHSSLIEETSRDSNEVLAVLFEPRIGLECAVSEAIRQRVVFHANKHVCVAKPFHRLLDVRYAAEAHFCVQVVRETLLELTFDWCLTREKTQVVSEFRIRSYNVCFTALKYQ